MAEAVVAEAVEEAATTTTTTTTIPATKPSFRFGFASVS